MSRGDEGMAQTMVACASHNCLLKLGLKTLLEGHPRIQLIAHSGQDTTGSDRLPPGLAHVLVVDMDMAGEVAAVIQHAKTSSPQTRIIVLSGLQDMDSAGAVVDYRVDAIVLKIQPTSVLIATIDVLARASDTMSAESEKTSVRCRPSARHPMTRRRVPVHRATYRLCLGLSA